MSNRRAILQSVDSALRLLETFSRAEPELTLAELSRRLGLGKSTVFRLLSTLEARGFVERNPETGRFRLGLKALYIGGLVIHRINLITGSQLALERLVRESGETAHLVVYERGEAVFVNKVESSRTVTMGSHIGARMPAYCTATGKVLLAHLPEGELERYLAETPLRRLTLHTITDPDRLREHLRQVREQGYAVDQQESEEGLMCVAAPIRGPQGNVVAAVSVSGPAVRLARQLPKMRELVQAAAAEISQNLGWCPGNSWGPSGLYGAGS
ncbi:MAG: IclR family transcriptional regulator [Firmicutes bacterium]|nr:IclR family transcriptional regulator [Bacillota bacterium]